MSRNENEETLGNAIMRMLDAYGLKEGYYTAAIVTYWEKIMGAAIARRTKHIRLKKGVLEIQLDSATLRQELSYGKEKIKREINRELGLNLIKSVDLK